MPACCNDDDATNAAVDAFEQYSDLLDCDKASFKSEFGRWQHACRSTTKSSTSIQQTLTQCDTTLYPLIHTLFRIFGTIPVTTCTAERSFSQLRLLKTHHRSTMLEERLNGLAMLAVHKDVKLDYDAVLDEYARKYDTRMKLID